MNCSFTLAPMSDNYIDIILGSIGKVDTTNIQAKTSRMATIYQGSKEAVFDGVKACFMFAYTDNVHMTMNMTLTPGQDGDEEEAINENALKDMHFPVNALLAIYTFNDETFIQEAIAKAGDIYKDKVLNKIELKGDVHEVFSYIKDIYEECDKNFERFAFEVGFSVNSPTSE